MNEGFLKKHAKRTLAYLFLILASLISIFPLYWSFISAFNNTAEILGGRMLPSTHFAENLKNLFAQQNVGRAMKNSLVNSLLQTFLALLVLAIFLIFVVYPLVLIMYKSVVNPADNSFTLANFTRFFTRKYYTNTLLNSFKVTVVSTLISATLGLVIAYITRQYRIAGSKALNICIVVSYLSPPFIGAYAWIQLLGRNGLFTKWINAIFGTSFGGIYGFAGIVLVFSLQSFPLVLSLIHI